MKFSVSADDGGLHSSIDAGIIAGVKEKIISEFSVVACGKNFLDFSDVLKKNRMTEVGFHACFTDGEKSLSGISILTDKNSRFISKSKLIFKSIFMPNRVQESLRKELRMQIDEIRKQGLTITHLDSHQHLHVLPFFHEVFLNLSLNLKVPMRIPKVIYFSPRISAIPLSIFSKILHKRSHSLSVLHYLSIGFEYSGNNNQKTIASYLERATQENLEFFCHPGESNKEIQVEYSHWGYDWESELEGLRNCVSNQNYPVKLRDL